MKLYKPSKRFNPRTGKETEPEFSPCGSWICDYSGEEIDLDDLQYRPMYELQPDYYDGLEQAYYYDDEKEFFEEKLNIDYSSLFEEPFVFKVQEDFTDNSFFLVKEWMENRTVKGHIFYDCRTIEEAMRKARVRTVKRLITEELYTNEQLGL
jgi:hypothetical protein